MSTATLPKTGDTIEMLSDPFGRVNGEWVEATVTGVSDDGRVISVTARGVGADGEDLPAGIGASSDMWRVPKKG